MQTPRNFDLSCITYLQSFELSNGIHCGTVPQSAATLPAEWLFDLMIDDRTIRSESVEWSSTFGCILISRAEPQVCYPGSDVLHSAATTHCRLTGSVRKQVRRPRS